MPAQTDEEFDEAEQQLQRTETEEQSDSKEQDAETAAASAAAHLQSGEDVIAFFARHGEASPIKFVHLNRADTGDIFRPYDLVVVDQDKVQPEHFTMSAKGVVHVCPNQPSEFVPLSEWMRESTLFNVLTSMKFFKYYLVGNTFRTWCNNVKFNLYCVKRNVLSRRLFAAKQSFCLPVMEINNLLAELEVSLDPVSCHVRSLLRAVAVGQVPIHVFAAIRNHILHRGTGRVPLTSIQSDGGAVTEGATRGGAGLR